MPHPTDNPAEATPRTMDNARLGGQIQQALTVVRVLTQTHSQPTSRHTPWRMPARR